MHSTESTVGGPLRKAFAILLKALGVLLASVVVLVILLMWACSAPSDKSLANRFARHRSEFETLARMSHEDADVIRIADDFTRLKNNWNWPRSESTWGITLERWNEYRRLFRRVGLSAGLEKDGPGNVYFIAHTAGLAVHGSSKGLVYCFVSGAPDETFLPCAEHQQQGRQEYKPGRGYSYRKLDGNWYIFEDWN